MDFEYPVLDLKRWDDLLVRSEPLIEDGHIEVPETPRLGIKLEKDVAEQHAAGEGRRFKRFATAGVELIQLITSKYSSCGEDHLLPHKRQYLGYYLHVCAR